MYHALVALSNPERREALARMVRGPRWQVATLASLAAARSRFPGKDFDVVFTEASKTGGVTWGRALHTCRTAVLVDPSNGPTAAGSLPPGFDAHLSAPFDPEMVKAILARLLGDDGVDGEPAEPDPPEALSARARNPARTRLIGESLAVRRAMTLLRSMAPAKAPVLITGETGTGKEVAARRLHELSRYSGGEFVAVNCGALSATLMDSQLFGHEKGSFSGAERRHRGVFERADRGTLFLDEITEMPAESQVKLLRILERGEFQRTGGEKELSVDVRTIAATNRSPEEAVAEGRLRADLYYRLRVLHLPLPPLRDRGQDVDLLAHFFLEQIADQEGQHKEMAPETLALLRSCSWPGNVRQLRNAIQTAYLMSPERVIPPLALPHDVLCGTGGTDQTGTSVRVPVGTSIAEVERRLIMLTLTHLAGNKTQTAQSLGISVKTLYNRLSEYRAHQPAPLPI